MLNNYNNFELNLFSERRLVFALKNVPSGVEARKIRESLLSRIDKKVALVGIKINELNKKISKLRGKRKEKYKRRVEKLGKIQVKLGKLRLLASLNARKFRKDITKLLGRTDSWARRVGRGSRKSGEHRYKFNKFLDKNEKDLKKIESQREIKDQAKSQLTTKLTSLKPNKSLEVKWGSEVSVKITKEIDKTFSFTYTDKAGEKSGNANKTLMKNILKAIVDQHGKHTQTKEIATLLKEILNKPKPKPKPKEVVEPISTLFYLKMNIGMLRLGESLKINWKSTKQEGLTVPIVITASRDNKGDKVFIYTQNGKTSTVPHNEETIKRYLSNLYKELGGPKETAVKTIYPSRNAPAKPKKTVAQKFINNLSKHERKQVRQSLENITIHLFEETKSVLPVNFPLNIRDVATAALKQYLVIIADILKSHWNEMKPLQSVIVLKEFLKGKNGENIGYEFRFSKPPGGVLIKPLGDNLGRSAHYDYKQLNPLEGKIEYRKERTQIRKGREAIADYVEIHGRTNGKINLKELSTDDQKIVSDFINVHRHLKNNRQTAFQYLESREINGKEKLFLIKVSKINDNWEISLGTIHKSFT